MKVLLSWLREFAPFEGDPVALGETMSDLGMAVESIDHLGAGLDGIVVARVLDLREHPDADKIQLVDVDAGDGEALQICCGAFNMAVGDLVPLATLGTVMPNGMEIARRKLRGEWSNGMLCSAAEIGLGGDAAGILVLSDGLVPGTPLREALGVEPDVLYDLEINPNRPDAMSVAGVARDLAARLALPFAMPSPTVATTGAAAAEQARVEIVDPDRCGRFGARLLHDVTVGSSPQWLANRLTALGMRPINRVVDISNYVMLELGHPNHTYDLDLVAGQALRVRAARDGEHLVTLDDVERTVRPEDTLICDGDDVPIGLAGVMGGASTEISATTSSVLLEMAWWPPMMIARTSKRLRLRSEASMRYERGIDPFGIDLALDRFCELAVAAGATVAPGTIDERGQLPAVTPIRVRTPRVNAMLGTDLTSEAIAGYLRPIGFVVEAGDDGAGQTVTSPGFRPDVATEIDVIEEVARHHSYSAIPRRRPPGVHTGALTERQRDRRQLRAVLAGLGISEALPLPFLAPEDLVAAGIDGPHVTVSNPLAAEESVLRPSLRPGLLGALAYNARHRNRGVCLFEVGHVFGVPPAGQQLPDEREVLGVVLGDAEAPAAVEVWRLLAEGLGFDDCALDAEGLEGDLAGLHPTRTARVLVGDRPVGVVGEVDPAVVAAHDLGERVALLEVDLDTLLALPHGARRYRSVSRYPSSDIDLAFEVDEAVPAGAVEATLRLAGGDLLAEVRLFDVFRGPSLRDGTRSLAYTLRFQAPDRTLTDAEVGEARSRLIEAVAGAHGATLR
ncbi:MAG: phenylalanine--tRNA ligase subunit beta [Acidimicrobiales bacterium]|nr:phenylalanine--tRNA ligase subunit beta [Acidimicrobiales bacterium]MCB1015096.1 phenylalanine--tRNA ligase subunit beta [Acidimicrobiales bacterium]